MIFFILAAFFAGWQVGLIHATFGVLQSMARSGVKGNITYGIGPGLAAIIFLVLGLVFGS